MSESALRERVRNLIFDSRFRDCEKDPDVLACRIIAMVAGEGLVPGSVDFPEGSSNGDRDAHLLRCVADAITRGTPLGQNVVNRLTEIASRLDATQVSERSGK